MCISKLQHIPIFAKLSAWLNNKSAAVTNYINQYQEKEFANKTFFGRETISRRKGPVVLVSREVSYTFPLSYGYLAGYLKEKGVEVVILFRDVSQKELVRKIISLNPILVGFGSLYPELEEIKNIIFKLNQAGRDFPIVIGGQMVSPIPKFALKLTGADFGVIGEGEIILHELFKALQNNTTFSKIGGLVIRNKNRVTINKGKGKYIEDLSKLPEIPYEFFDVNKWIRVGRWYTQHYPQQPHWRFNDKVINVHGGRGCPFKCNFCYHHNKTRYRDIDDMMDDAEKMIERFDANMLYFSDDLVIANPRRVRQLIERIKRLKRPISYSVSTRFDILERISDPLLEELKATGCRIIGAGVESGSDRILKIIGKNTTFKKILRELRRLKEVGIHPTTSIMVGQYTENREDVEKSFEIMRESVRENPVIAYAFTIATPFPGSILHNLIFQKKLMKDEDEFYKRYVAGRVAGDWNQVINLSKIPDDEVIRLRSELEKACYEEKVRTFGQTLHDKINRICNRQTQLAEVFESKTEREKMRAEKIYSAGQLRLEKKKLALMGVD